MGFTVSQVAKLSGVSVRTLHHYDEIGLLTPSARTDAGYRLYEDADLQRLQQVLFFRELGFSLEQIARILGDPGFDLRAALQLQRQLLTEKSVRIRALISAVEATLESLERGTKMKHEEMFEVFGDFDPSRYEQEAKERWGGTAAYSESARRTKGYRKEDWARLKEEETEIVNALAQAKDAGKPPSSEEAKALAERHRLHIDRWFYSCPPPLHRRLGEGYVSDPRFTEYYDRVRPGLARHLRDAIAASCGAA